jgi:hypothetical protein
MDEAQFFLDAIAERLAGQGFSIQRRVTAGPYVFDTLASRVGSPAGPYVPIPWSTLIAVSRVNVPDAESASAFSSFVAKYALDNRSSFGGYKMDMKTIAVMVSSAFSDETKKWVSEARPEGSTIKDRFEFPVLLEMSTRQIIYFRKTPFRAGLLYRQLRKLSDGWFSFQT